MRCVPIQRNKGVYLIFAALLLVGGISYAVPAVCSAHGIKVLEFPFSIITLFSLVAAVFVLVRYCMTGFVYIIRMRSEIEENGMEASPVGGGDIRLVRREYLDFVVTKSQGIRPGTMECVMSLGDLKEVVVLEKGVSEKKDVRARYAEYGFVFYDYTLTLGNKDALELVFEDGSRYVGIIIEPDEKMKEYLLSLC